MRDDAQARTLQLPTWPVAETWCVTMRVPPDLHTLHGREPSCILRRNMHVCALYKAGHARGAPVAGHGAQAPVPSMRRSVSLPGPRLGGGCGLPAGALSRRLPYGEATLRPGCTVLIEGRVQWWRTAQGSRSRNTQAVIAERIQCLSCPRQTPCAAASGGGTRRGAQLVGGPSVATALPG